MRRIQVQSMEDASNLSDGLIAKWLEAYADSGFVSDLPRWMVTVMREAATRLGR